ncbi:MAG: pyruvate, phosphate dikinase [Chloroflexi bacterium]|nr:pyruvate, phosphate dikinase [Chloroflexota bacterium]
MKLIYSLREGFKDKDQLGNKGANLVEMTGLGLEVPPGFVVSIEAYKEWRQNGLLPYDAIKEAVATLEREAGRKLGEGLEVSVRSSAPVSMPGMMDTVLNIGNYEQMVQAIQRIFESWDNVRAVEYRRLHGISPMLGTAAIVQAMVYGNRDGRSGTGVVFTRNPSTGGKGLFGEYMLQAQGEDLVSGARTPDPVSSLESRMPEVYAELARIADRLERHYRDAQDIEFTIESGKLYILQTRSAKRSPRAAIKMAVDMVSDNLLTREEAIMRVTYEDVQKMLHKQLKQPVVHQPIVNGLNAAPGAAGGKVYFDAMEALAQSRRGIPVILVRPETSPDDIMGIAAAAGVLTQRGGMTSHAAIVTRAMGKPCVAGAEAISVDVSAKQFSVNNKIVREADEITIDGTTGNVYVGLLPVEEVSLSDEVRELLSWADGFKRLGVRANADTPEMINQARLFGAEGIGLCRTERMFSGPERLSSIREYILAENPARRAAAIDNLRELQARDFIALFRELQGMPIVIRLLDLPLHEFLPPLAEVADTQVRQRIAELEEVNPMLGHRGVRLAITDPELYRMQIEAILRARVEVPADISVLIPQVITAQEALTVKGILKSTDGTHMKVGVMMETVRACMRAGRIAREVDFLSFGTNDLTQAVYSFSREDAENKFLTTYLERGVLLDNPFEVLDIKGVGRLMETAIFWARRYKKDIEIGVCGEHAGEPKSMRYLHGTGVDYLSCSPFRIPVAKLVAAQAALESRVAAQPRPQPGVLAEAGLPAA